MLCYLKVVSQNYNPGLTSWVNVWVNINVGFLSAMSAEVDVSLQMSSASGGKWAFLIKLGQKYMFCVETSASSCDKIQCVLCLIGPLWLDKLCDS